MDASFRPKAGRFGTEQSLMQIDAGASPLTASSTVTRQFPGYARRKFISRLTAAAVTIAAGGAAITAIVKKWDDAAGAYVNLTAAFDLTTMVTKRCSVIPILATLTDSQRTMKDNDTLAIDLIAAGTVTTQPINLGFSAEVAILE